MLLPQWQAIATMADRIGTEIENDSEKAKVRMMNSAGDEIVEYAIHYAQMALTHQTSQRRRKLVPGVCPFSCWQRGSKCCSEISSNKSNGFIKWLHFSCGKSNYN